MLIDCDTCTVRGAGCQDCVVTVLLGAPPGGHDSDPTVVSLIGRGRPSADATGGAAEGPGPVVELDDVERRAVRALAEFGLVPPLRHQDASSGRPVERRAGDRSVS